MFAVYIPGDFYCKTAKHSILFQNPYFIDGYQLVVDVLLALEPFQVGKSLSYGFIFVKYEYAHEFFLTDSIVLFFFGSIGFESFETKDLFKRGIIYFPFYYEAECALCRIYVFRSKACESNCLPVYMVRIVHIEGAQILQVFINIFLCVETEQSEQFCLADR